MVERLRAAGMHTVFVAEGVESAPVGDSALEWVHAPPPVARTLAMAAGELGPHPGVYFDGDWAVATGLVSQTEKPSLLSADAALPTLRSLSPRWFVVPSMSDQGDTPLAPDAQHGTEPDSNPHPDSSPGAGATGASPAVSAVGEARDPRDLAIPAILDDVWGFIVGPGVRRSGREADWRALSISLGLGVFNTIGAKGFFEWDDPLHLGTVGLQVGDAHATGLPPGSLLAAGIDHVELPDPGWNDLIAAHVPVNAARALTRSAADSPVTVERLRLGLAAALRQRTPGMQRRFYDTVSRLAQQLYAGDVAPGGPAALMGELSGMLQRHRLPISLVSASPGVSGFIVGRLFPTPSGARVLVPARNVDGGAVALAVVAALARPDLIPLAFVDDVQSPMTSALLEWARRLGLTVLVVHWTEGSGSSGELGRRLLANVTDLRSGVTRDRVLIAEGQARMHETIATLVEALGPIALWRDAPRLGEV